MATRPADVRIDDLAVPAFPAEVEAIRSAMAAMGADLTSSPTQLLAAAADQTGLDDFGDGRFREPLAVLCGALRTEAGLSPAGVTSAWSQLVMLLKNRLLVEDVLKRHPEIHDVAIERPDHHRGPAPHGHDPSAQPHLGRPRPALAPVLGEPRARARRRRAAAARRARPARGPHRAGARRAQHRAAVLPADARDDDRSRARGDPAPRHRLLDDAVRDDGASCRRGATGTSRTDQTPTYRYLETVLKVLQWQRGGVRWVLKSPQHLEQFRPADGHLPRRHVRRDPPRPGVDHRVARHDGQLLGPAQPRPRRPASHRALLGRSHRGHAPRVRRRPRPAARRPLDRRPLPRVHGRRRRHGRAHLRASPASP